MTINFNAWPWKLNWVQRLCYRFMASYRCAADAVRREETAAAWEASGRATKNAHPGYAPGSPQDVAYQEIERERSRRLVMERVENDPLTDPSLRDELMRAFKEAQT